MSIDVVEGGAIEATQAQVIKSRVEGREGTTILKIIDEGYQVTEKDVAEGLVLVELDSSAIVERIKAQETDVQAALANWMEYVKMREIRESANLSSIRTPASRPSSPSWFKKYLGEEAAQSILDDIGLSEETIDDDAGNAINASKSLFASSLMGAANSNAIESGDGAIMGGLESPEDLFNSWGEPMTRICCQISEITMSISAPSLKRATSSFWGMEMPVRNCESCRTPCSLPKPNLH